MDWHNRAVQVKGHLHRRTMVVQSPYDYCMTFCKQQKSYGPFAWNVVVI